MAEKTTKSMSSSGDYSALADRLTDTLNLEIIEPVLRVYRAYKHSVSAPHCQEHLMCLVNRHPEQDKPGKSPKPLAIVSKPAKYCCFLHHHLHAFVPRYVESAHVFSFTLFLLIWSFLQFNHLFFGLSKNKSFKRSVKQSYQQNAYQVGNNSCTSLVNFVASTDTQLRDC